MNVRNSSIEKSHSNVLYLSGVTFFLPFKCTEPQFVAHCGLEEPLLNTLSGYTFCTLKSSRFHPLAAWLCTRNTIFMRDRSTAAGKGTLHSAAVGASPSPGLCPKPALRTRRWGAQEPRDRHLPPVPRVPSDTICDNCQGDVRERLSLLGTGLRTLRCPSQGPLSVCHVVLPL